MCNVLDVVVALPVSRRQPELLLHFASFFVHCSSFTLPSRLLSIPFVSLELRFELLSPFSALSDAFKPTHTDGTEPKPKDATKNRRKKPNENSKNAKRNEQKIPSDVKQNARKKMKKRTHPFHGFISFG